MQISRQRIKQLDILGYIEKCDQFRAEVWRLEELGQLVSEWAEVSAERCSLQYEGGSREEVERLEEIERQKEAAACSLKWVYFSAGRYFGLYLDDLPDDDEFGLTLSGEDLLSDLLEECCKTEQEKERVKKFSKYELVEISARVKEKQLREELERRAEFDEAATEREIKRLESKRFPVAYLIEEGAVYAELNWQCEEWEEVTEQLGELLHFKQLASGEQLPQKREALTLIDKVRQLDKQGYFWDVRKNEKSEVRAAHEVAALLGCGWTYAKKMIRIVTDKDKPKR